MHDLFILIAFVIGFIAGSAAARDRIAAAALKVSDSIKEARTDRTIKHFIPKPPVSEAQRIIEHLEHEARKN